MGASRYTVSLRVRHPSNDPRDIATVLGERRGALMDTVVAGGHMPPDSMAAELDRVLDEFSAHRAFLHRTRVEGGRSELFAGWFLVSQAGETFSRSTSAKMANLGIDLALDTYASPEHRRD
jgi:hypothetical protein